jgi:hypothetical protein
MSNVPVPYPKPVLYMYMFLYLVNSRAGLKKRLSGLWDTEEMGCQAHEKFSLGERIVGNCFPEGAKLQLQGSETSCPTYC